MSSDLLESIYGLVAVAHAWMTIIVVVIWEHDYRRTS